MCALSLALCFVELCFAYYACRLPSVRARFPNSQFTVDLSLNYLTVKDMDVVVQWLDEYTGLRVVVNDNSFDFDSLRKHFEEKSDSFRLLR